MESEWPGILKQAKQTGASLFFGDEASFALWGSRFRISATRLQSEFQWSSFKRMALRFDRSQCGSGSLSREGNSDSFFGPWDLINPFDMRASGPGANLIPQLIPQSFYSA
jgi:hypothetical protein